MAACAVFRRPPALPVTSPNVATGAAVGGLVGATVGASVAGAAVATDGAGVATVTVVGGTGFGFKKKYAPVPPAANTTNPTMAMTAPVFPDFGSGRGVRAGGRTGV